MYNIYTGKKYMDDETNMQKSMHTYLKKSLFDLPA